MAVFGILLIVLAIPLFISYAIQDNDKKDKGRLRLGAIMGGVGLVLLFLK